MRGLSGQNLWLLAPAELMTVEMEGERRATQSPFQLLWGCSQIIFSSATFWNASTNNTFSRQSFLQVCWFLKSSLFTTSYNIHSLVAQPAKWSLLFSNSTRISQLQQSSPSIAFISILTIFSIFGLTIIHITLHRSRVRSISRIKCHTL